MKPTYILPLLAFAIAPALSQPRNAASDRPTLSSGDVSVLCTEAGALIASQLGEIKHLQSSKLPVPGDLAGYFYSVVYSRKLLGCPSTPLLSSANSKRSPVYDEHPEVQGDPCKTLHALYEQVLDPINVLKSNDIPVPPYLVGAWSLVADGERGLKCGFAVSPTIGGNSTTSSNGSV